MWIDLNTEHAALPQCPLPPFNQSFHKDITELLPVSPLVSKTYVAGDATVHARVSLRNATERYSPCQVRSTEYNVPLNTAPNTNVLLVNKQASRLSKVNFV